MDEILKNGKSLPNSRLFLQAEAVQTIETGYGPLPPAIMDQLAAAAAASYVTQPGPPPGQQQQQQQQPQHQPPPRAPNLVDTAVQTDVTTVVQSKQEMARAQIAAANRLLASTSSITFNSCEYCGRVFAKKEYLRRHVRIHTGERPYRCVVCQLSFRRSHHLRRHELMHTDVKPFGCHLCDKAFKQKQHLDRHLTSHSGEKPFACHLCEKAFTRKQHLDRHVKMHTGELERTYKCHVCEKMFFRSHHRDKHLKSHGIAALETKNRNLNFLPLNIDLTKPGAVEALSATSPHSGTSDSSDSDDEKQPTPDKQNSQVTKLEGCRKRKTHSPVRLALGEKKSRSSKNDTASNTTTSTNTGDANGQNSALANQRSTFDYGGMRNDIVFPRNEAVSAMAMRDNTGGNNGNNGGNNGGMNQQTGSSTDGGMQTPHHLGSGNQGIDMQQQSQQQHFAMGAAMNCLSAAQLQQMMAGQRTDIKVDPSSQQQEAGGGGGGNGGKSSQPLVVPTSHFSSASKMAEIQQPKYTSAAAAIAGRQLQQAGVGMGVGVMEQPVHFKSVVGAQGAATPHQTWPPALNWPPRLSLLPDGSLQSVPALTTYGTVNMADLNQVSGAAMYSAQKAMEMRMAAGLHRSPSLGGDAWVPVSVGSDRNGQRGGPSAGDRRIYSPQPST
ncbi:RE1-silencing transcription factor-like isoform X3 [Pomacea canaliculata]|uniref:RE1-silencing transcription factor-like isoform X3 n=1 Tax=Pomacea canaliculata TaxID=400727 RepID=UPI000D733084|nr:RE1-silencing transcription factor-like isoform X3 [Pomacea canaliculata]XP_025091946.1 RE1-silencing transcription factor-like isoform X3 [Pomacea canaliculata]